MEKLPNAKSSENTSYKHNSIVSTSVMDAVKPIFAELASPKLLKKCLGGKTRNSNESFNSTVWKYCPETSGSTKRIVEIEVNEASDNARIKEAEMKSRSSTLDARRALRMRKKAMHEHFVEIEGGGLFGGGGSGGDGNGDGERGGSGGFGIAGVSDLSDISYSDLPDASDLPDLSSLSMSDLPSGKQF
ncbi:hypothetical protein TNCV_4720151 [Trichonephila clavipes]|uniref:Uncharacterized protein n=1 Tax=Trichonephila clavipes TaxID=2585209 RepID=A0A8X6W658_TRICX|nr:hypothetical protein TNCV_4720151 [Trichonephila clavipes]